MKWLICLDDGGRLSQSKSSIEWKYGPEAAESEAMAGQTFLLVAGYEPEAPLRSWPSFQTLCVFHFAILAFIFHYGNQPERETSASYEWNKRLNGMRLMEKWTGAKTYNQLPRNLNSLNSMKRAVHHFFNQSIPFNKTKEK